MYVNKVHISLGDAWISCLRSIINEGKEIPDGNVMIKEITNYYMTILNVSEEDPILNRFADKKRIALMKEKYNSCNILPGYDISYGKLIYDNQGVNQIEWVINRLKNKMETKSATISLHRPNESSLSCLSLIDFKIRNNKLNMSVVYRSQNAFASQPGNFIALAGMQEYVANCLNIPIGIIEGIILSVHIYHKDMENAVRVLREYDELYNRP